MHWWRRLAGTLKKNVLRSSWQEAHLYSIIVISFDYLVKLVPLSVLENHHFSIVINKQLRGDTLR